MNTRPHSGAAAFSLVEISLSIGIVAFAFLGILGLLPAGMHVFRDSMNTSVSSQIAQRLLNEAQETDFSVLIGDQEDGSIHVVHAIRYFDDQGNELTEARASSAIYEVRVVAQSKPLFPDGSGKNTVLMANLATVTAQIAYNPAHHAIQPDANSLWTAGPSVPIQNYSVLVADHE